MLTVQEDKMHDLSQLKFKNRKPSCAYGHTLRMLRESEDGNASYPPRTFKVSVHRRQQVFLSFY